MYDRHRASHRATGSSSPNIPQAIHEKSRIAFLCALRDSGTWLNDADGEDAIQEAMIGFWNGWRREPGNYAYAFACARNRARQYIARIIDRCVHEVDGLDSVRDVAMPAAEPPDGIPSEIVDDVESLLFNSRRKRGRRGLEATSRDVFIINAAYRGWSNEAIATALEVPVSSIKTYRQRIRGMLRRILVEKENER